MNKRLNFIKGKHIMVMAGGTGGHIFSALSVANVLVQKGAIVSWLGTYYGLERKLVGNIYPINYIYTKSFHNCSLINKVLSPFRILFSIFQAIIILKKRHTQISIGFGSYPSGVGGLASKIMGIPLIIHEQNTIPGFTNYFLSKFSNKILCAFPSNKFKNKKIDVIGNPIRKEIYQIYTRIHNFYRHNLHILVLGGSQGAKFLNDQIPLFLKNFQEVSDLCIWHQTGKNEYNNTIKNYRYYNLFKKLNIKIVSFINNMSEAYQWADIVISRSGALTVSEITIAGIPAFFVPFPYARKDHQYHNAQLLVEAKAAICIRQEDFSLKKLITFIRNVNLNRDILVKMSKNAKNLAKLNTIEKLLKSIEELV